MELTNMFTLIATLVLFTGIADADYQSNAGPGNILGAIGGSQRGFQQAPFIPILKDDRSQNAYGEYSFNYESADGTQRYEEGTQNDGQNTQGSWSYTSPEGVPVQITFVADQYGYQPQGAVLPVAPPLPYKRT